MRFTSMASDNELLIFGYACTVYHDDEKALQVEKALIPWIGDETITIDRYDGRGHLNSLREFQSANGFSARTAPNVDSDEELAEAERWLSLKDDEAREEILKRAAAPVETHFNEIGFNYEENRAETFEDKVGVENRPRDFEDPDEKPYKVPKGLTIPLTVPRPDSRREHIIIQKTASFIARQGAQLEVVIKAKQKDNPQFAFMDIEHRLNLYYRFLVQQIKSGLYRPIDNEADSDSDSDQSDGYLHPSLFAKSSVKSKGPPEDLKNLFKSSANNSNCAYSQLISKIRPSVDDQQDDSQGDDGTLNTLKDLAVVMPPPPDVQPIVDKMAEYVAKNGKDFEDSIRAKGDPKFNFIQADSEFYEYYQHKLKEYQLNLKESSDLSKSSLNQEPPAQPAEVKQKSPNALQRIALDNPCQNSSSESKPNPRRIEKKKLKISLKCQDKTSTPSESKVTCFSLIGPLLPSLYDDEDDIILQEQDRQEGETSCVEQRETSTLTSNDENPSREHGAIEVCVSTTEESLHEGSKEFDESMKSPLPKKLSPDNRVNDLKCNSEEASISTENFDDPLKKKQLERKQKLAAFLSTLKSKNKDDSTSSCKSETIEQPQSSSTQLDLKSTIRNLRKAVVQFDDDRDIQPVDDKRKHPREDRHENKRRRPSSSDRKNHKHKRRDKSPSENSSENHENGRLSRHREKKRRRSSSSSRSSSYDGRSRHYSSRKHHKGNSSRNRHD